MFMLRHANSSILIIGFGGKPCTANCEIEGAPCWYIWGHIGLEVVSPVVAGIKEFANVQTQVLFHHGFHPENV
jgi:hypothetical protein